MTFQELENIRSKYNEKRKKISHRIIYSLLIIYIIYIFIIIINKISNSKLPLLETINDLLFLVIGSFLPMVAYAAIIYIILFTITVSIATNEDEKIYHDAYKNYFVSSIFSKCFTGVSYSHTSGMPYFKLSKTEMIKLGDRYSSNDYTRAKYKGLQFEQADVHIEESYRDSDGDTHYSTIFRGRYIIYDLSKKFSKKLLVVSKYFNAEKYDKTFKKIELESIDFNKNFKVYAQDGFEAFYLLDPAVMERIQKLSTLHNDRIMVCFCDGKIHIAINNNVDSFEPAPVNKPIDEQQEFDKVANDVKVVTNIVDKCKLVG